MEFTATSGANVEIKLAPFAEAMRLKNAITKELVNVKFDFSSSLSNLAQIDATAFLEAALKVDGSEEVQEATFKCLGRCLYNGQKITKETFELEGAREDYYQVVFECLKANLSPFFKGLVSKLNGLKSQISTPAQQSQ